MMEKYRTLKDTDMSLEARVVEDRVRQLELARDLSRTIVHIDMDAFYAAVCEFQMNILIFMVLCLCLGGGVGSA
jgi:hypothetical protein